MSKTILIANPYPGGAQYTTVRKASEYIRLGRASINIAGELQFVHSHVVSMSEQAEANALFWNGNRHPWLMHKPGEVVS